MSTIINNLWNTDGSAGDSDGNGSKDALYTGVIIHGLDNATLQPNINLSQQPKLQTMKFWRLNYQPSVYITIYTCW